MSWLVRDPKNPDRGYFLAVGILFAIGVFMIGAAIVVALTAAPNPSYSLQRAEGRVEWGAWFGAMFIVIAVGGLVYRWIHGPQAPGRHTHDPTEDESPRRS